MAIPPADELKPDAAAALIELDGDEIGSRDYRYSKIGAPIPINSDPQCLPSQPLAVSQRFRLVFIAHPDGFCVARTKDLMASAEEIKEKQTGLSVRELSLVDVPIGKVEILALSCDDSVLAAGVDGHVHFFAVSALLHKEQKPSYSVPLDDSIVIKDFRWARKVAKDYVILSTNGKLYHGSGQGSLIYVMEDVDSVDWSVEGNFVAVAKMNTVSILSPQFKEQLKFLLQFHSVIGDSDVNQVIKVDSIQWIRPDCIAVGCFQLNDDGEEENYIVQLITSRAGRITDAASRPIVLSFNNVFLDFSPDAAPTRNGPHLIFNYLDLYGLAFIANRNFSPKVGLFRWSLDGEQNEAAMVEILNDNWNLYIDSQDNGEENVIVGLSVDKVSQNENVRFTLGDEEKEVPPCCVIICLTIDGKISLFHFASGAGALVSPEECASDEKEDAPRISTTHGLSLISSADGKGSGLPTFLTSESKDLSRIEVGKTDAKATITNNLLLPSVDIRSGEQIATGNTGQKPLVNSETVKVDDPKKAVSLGLNQDSKLETPSTSEVKHSTALFPGKAVAESLSNYPLSASNVEPLGKAVPTNSQNVGSLTRSNARVDASKTSEGRFLSLSSEVNNSDKHAVQSSGGVLQHHTDLKERAKSSVTYTSFGQAASTAQWNKNLLPEVPGSKIPLVESVASGKPFSSESKKESNAAFTPAGMPHYAQNASKHFGNVEEMAKKLDALLEGIEGKGGFIDASITSQINSVVELEDDIWALADRCRIWRGSTNEQLTEVQLLLDKTVQVLVRKVYMEGIFKQATDSRYWDLWNRQKLSSELELKQRRISELNQELTNKLIDLERHFNMLEFKKFGENGGTLRNRRVPQNWHGHSRQIQSLHSLHNTTRAQLAAAEQLSGCLSKQMAALSVESSGKHDVKQKLFESIGLSYVGDTKRSPAKNRDLGTPSNKEPLVNSGSISALEQSRRNHTSFAKSCEPETARRRRDSLDSSWATFDPPKTTVKRMLKEDNEMGSANRSLLKIDRKYLSPQSQKKSEVAHSSRPSISATSLNSYKSKGTEKTAEQFTGSPSSSLYQIGYLDHGIKVSSTKSSADLPPPTILGPRMAQNSAGSRLPFTGKNEPFAAKESKSPQHSDTSFHLLPSMSTQLPEKSLTSHSTESSDSFKIGFTKSTSWVQKNTGIASESPLFDSKVPVTPVSAFSSDPNVTEKGFLTVNLEKRNQRNGNLSASVPLQSGFNSSLLSSDRSPSLASFAPKPSSSTLFPATPSSSGAGAAEKQENSQPQTSGPSTLNLSSTLPSLAQESNLSTISSSSTIVKSESQTSLAQSPIVMYGSKTEGVSQTPTSVANMPSKDEKDVKIQASTLHPGSAISTSDLKVGPLTPSAPTTLSTNPKSGSDTDLGSSSNSSSVLTSVKAEPRSATEALSPPAPSSEGIIGSAKSVISDSSDEEEEMEEEAPETDQTTEFASSLGGFGIGSTPNSTTPKSNPFGVAGNNNTTFTPSSFMTSVPSGELFRPASFNFQSPQPSQPLQPTAVGNFSGGFSSGIPGQASATAGFGQPANIGSGQQALGSVLGSFGQSRQFGTGLPGSNVPSASGFASGFTGVSGGGFGGGFASASSGGGFANQAARGGFAAAATAGGGFAAAATAGGGFAAAATSGGGFAAATVGGGFASSATAGAIPGGGFGGFSNQQGSGGFSAFGGGSGAARPPFELFTQMRK